MGTWFIKSGENKMASIYPFTELFLCSHGKVSLSAKSYSLLILFAFRPVVNDVIPVFHEKKQRSRHGDRKGKRRVKRSETTQNDLRTGHELAPPCF